MPDFAAAGAAFLANSTLQELYGFHKPGWPADAYTYLMNETACVAYIGSGAQYRDWDSVSNTINTWVLPFTGLLLQAPFDSNNFFATFLVILRWTGGSMASLSYVLWNMRTSANCAAFVDKATHRKDIPAQFDKDEKGNERHSDFASVRDAFFILSAMNQFVVNPKLGGASAEKLLKIALFSRQLRLKSGGESDLELVRKAKARDSRESRKRGTVQCFLSMGWFLFGMVISIQQAFGLLGQNMAAHDLALGLNVIWFPVLMLCTTVDRNPAVPEATMRNLNAFMARVRQALLQDYRAFKETHLSGLASRVDSSDTSITTPPTKIAGLNSVRSVSPTSPTSTHSSSQEAGDAQNWFKSAEYHSADDLRWINSIADPALDDAEFFVEFAGQGRVFWHYGVAHPILAGLQNDGILNPQRGWLYDSDVRAKLIGIANHERKDRLHSFDLRELWQFLFSTITVWMACMSAFVISYFTGSVGLGCRSLGYLVFAVNQTGMTLIEMGIWYYTPHHKFNTVAYKRTRYWGLHFLRFAEFANTTWLLYSIFAQVLGAYNTCKCKVSDYGIGGGFINWQVTLDPSSTAAQPYWIAGTVMGCTNLIFCFGFIAWEWVTQSHLSSENYDKAMKGLAVTRRFKQITRFCLPFQA